jgi:hypothetical protein
MTMTAEEFRDLALALEATVEIGHFDRRAFRARRIFASLAPDERSANIHLTPEEQEHYASLQPEVLSPLPNEWGARGWTRLLLDGVDTKTAASVLYSAWVVGAARKK